MRNAFEKLEKISIFLLFLLLPLSDERLLFLGIPFYLPEILVSSMLLIRVGLFLSGEKPRRVPIAASIAIGLLLAGVVSSSAVNGMDHEALGAIKSWFLFPMAFAWVLYVSLRSERDVWGMISFWFFGAASLSFFSLILPSITSETYDGRTWSVFPSPNHFGFFLEYAAILGVGLMLLMRKHIKTLVFLIFSETAVVSALFLTKSDGAILSTAIASVALLALALPSTTATVKKVLVTCLVAFAVLPIAVFFSLDREALGSGDVRSSLASRVMIWNTAAEMITKHPVVGIGPRNFEESYLALQPMFPSYLEWAVGHPHNTILSFWLFSGITGLFGFILLLAVLFRGSAVSLLHFSGSQRILSSVLFSLLLSFCLHGLVDTLFFKNDLSYVLFAVAAFVLFMNNKKGADAPKVSCDESVGTVTGVFDTPSRHSDS